MTYSCCVVRKPLKILCSQGHTCQLSLATVEPQGCNNLLPQLLDFQAYLALRNENETNCFGTSAGFDRGRGVCGQPTCANRALHKSASGGQPRQQLERLLYRRH